MQAPALIAAIAVLCLAGCSTSRKQVERREERRQTTTVEKIRTERSTVAPDGTPFVEVTLTTRVLEEKSTAEASAELTGSTTLNLPVLDTAIGLAKGAAGGGMGAGGVAAIITSITTALAGAWGIHKQNQEAKQRAEAEAARARAIVERERAEEHRRDAAEGWALAQQNALAVPPPDRSGKPT